MGGFLINSLNTEFEAGVFEIIIERLLYCSEIMRRDCIAQATRIRNHEVRIRNRLLEQYLNNNDIQKDLGLRDIYLRFIPEAQENYSDTEDSYSGCADIKVVTENWFKYDINDYYIIECKRIDGSEDLNKKYVVEGIFRFVVEPIKYISQHHRNIMFGFVVTDIDIPQNTANINTIQSKTLKDFVKMEISLLKNNNQYFLFSSSYSLRKGLLELRHIFYDFAQIIQN